jgi:restriction system protein
VVRELYGVMAARKASGGYVVTSGRFTKDAIQFAQGRNIELIDGDQLHGLLREKTEFLDQPNVVPIRPAAKKTSSPSCPRCHEPMTERVAKRGNNVGEKFWGCSHYPKCRATLPKTA